MNEGLFQDEPGMESRRLSKWFASRLGVRHHLRQMFPGTKHNHLPSR